MIFFITILFIIEILIAAAILAGIICLNKKINCMNDTILENRYQIKIIAENIQNQIKDIYKFIKSYSQSIVDKERKVLMNLAKNFIIGTAIMLLSKKYKKQILFLELLLVAYETYKTSLKA